MQWSAWAPTYQRILDDFGYDRAADEAARDELATLLVGRARVDLAALRAQLSGREVAVAGPHARPMPDAPLLATDAASWAFDKAVAIVTDLDGDVAAQARANARGVPLFVHAHGDNRATLARVVPTLTGRVQGTTQAEPADDIINVGGFTDGDRACCLAAHLGASGLLLVGFDWDAPVAKPGRDPAMKRRKLAWARTIVGSLGLPVRML